MRPSTGEGAVHIRGETDRARFAFAGFSDRNGDEHLKACWLTSRHLTSGLDSGDPLEGYCIACGLVQPLAGALGQASATDVREGLICPRCRLSARVRACLGELSRYARPDARIYLTEQSTLAYAWMQARYRHLAGSEFAPDANRRAALAQSLREMGGHGDIRHEDATCLTFRSGSLDAIASFDVLEHIPDYQEALAEFARTLVPGGVLLATFPFNDESRTLVRASIAGDGSIVHHHPAEYHGDPIGDPILCYYHFGWDILDSAREAGFSAAEMVMPWAPEEGILYGHWMLVGTR